MFQPKAGKTVDPAQPALLKTTIDGFLTGSKHPTLLWQEVWDALPPSLREAIAILRIVILHERDGLVAELVKAGDVEALDVREVLRLRTVQQEGAG